MTEAEVLETIFDVGGHMGENIQFWISVSFAVLVAAHLTKGQVSMHIIVVALVFYTGFTWIIGNMVLFQVEMIRSGVSTLSEMARLGEPINMMSEGAIKHGPVATASTPEFIARRSVLVGMYLLTCAYPVFCYYTAKSKAD